MTNYIAVGIGGFLGACLRFGVSKSMINYSNNFPLSTFIINIFAGFLIGFIFVMKKNTNISPQTNLLITTGFLGGLSTFSTFSLESVNLINDNKFFLGFLYITLSVVLSFIAVTLGIFLAQLIFKK